MGCTIPEVDKILAPYYKMSKDSAIVSLNNEIKELNIELSDDQYQKLKEKRLYEVYRVMKQSLQALEMRYNVALSARGSFPFTTFTFGDCNTLEEAEICKAILEVRMEGHGDPGKKRVLIFPKLVFLYDHNKHDEGKLYEWLFNLATECSSKNMYPDYLSPKYHKRENRWVSPIN